MTSTASRTADASPTTSSTSSLQVVAGELVGKPNDLGDGVDANDVAFMKSFPYVALPHSGSTVR